MDVDEGGPRLECLVSGLDLLGGRDRDGGVVLLARDGASDRDCSFFSKIGGDYAGYNRLYL